MQCMPECHYGVAETGLLRQVADYGISGKPTRCTIQVEFQQAVSGNYGKLRIVLFKVLWPCDLGG